METNRIREECSVDYNLSPQITKVMKEEFATEFGIKVTVNHQKDVVKKFLMEKFWKLSILEDMSDWWLSKIDELLKSQREELVEKINEKTKFAFKTVIKENEQPEWQAHYRGFREAVRFIKDIIKEDK